MAETGRARVFKYLARRALLMVPTFFGITLLTFAIAHLAPGDPLQLDPEQAHGAGAVAEFKKAQGLDRPLAVQYLAWVGKVATFDFGRSLVDHQPVSTRLAQALPRSLLLSGTALVLAWGLAVPLGVYLAVRRKQWLARAASAALAVVWGVPTFWVAVLLLLLFASGRVVDWFPFQGLTSDVAPDSALGRFFDVAWHLVLPVLCLTYPALALATRHVRSAMQDVLNQDYIRAARARGIPERRVLTRHALRNGLVPLLTLLGLHLPHVVGGSVIVERVFGIPGMGLLAFDAIGTRDYPVVMAVATVMALVTMLSMLAVDVTYALADPRIRVEGRS